MAGRRRAAAFVPTLARSLNVSTFAPSFALPLTDPTLRKHSTRNPDNNTKRKNATSTPSAVVRPPPNRPQDPTPLPSDALLSQRPAPQPPTVKDNSLYDNEEDDDDVCFIDECEESYRRPPPEIARLVDANADPNVSLQPVSKHWMVLLDRPNLPPIAEVAADELRLAGFRINANTYAPSRADYYIGMSMQRVNDPERIALPVTGLPIPTDPEAPFFQFAHLRWAPDGSRFAFCVYDPYFGLELWMMRPEDRHAKCLLKGIRLNAVCGDPFTWCADSRNIIAKFVLERRRLPHRPSVPRGPVIQENLSNKPAPSRTFQDLLKSRYDRRLFGHYTTCQLGLVNTDECTVRYIGQPAAFRRASPSPDDLFLLVDAIIPPFPYMMPAGRFPRSIEVWDTKKGTVACVVAEIPLQDKIPIAFDGVGEGPRGIGWRSDADATLYWAEAQDGGDPNQEADIRDCIFTLSKPFTGAPRKLASLPWRYSGIVWGSDSVALISERKYKTRSARSYLVAPGPPTPTFGAADDGDNGVPSDSEAQGPCCARACNLSQGDAPKRLLFNVPNWEDRYNDPGSVCTMKNSSGKLVLRLIYPNGRSAVEEDGKIGRPFLLLQGAGASEAGDRPFLRLFDTVSETTTMLWQSEPPAFQSIAMVMKEDSETGAPMEVLIRQEGQKENPNFFVCDMRRQTAGAFKLLADVTKGVTVSERMQGKEMLLSVGGSGQNLMRALTQFPHPAPLLMDVQRDIVNYKRADGVRLNASLYLPPGYDSERDGPLPVFIWAYPREYKSAEFAGQTKGSPHRFVRLARTPLYWLTRGYAILDGPEMPIIGEGDDEGNDTYIEQLVMSAEAAVNFLEDRGIGKRGHIAIGGHSYGAFMTVNVLAHAPKLFCCGIARSGAYNRTLTPFGFQSEERTLWEAKDVYQNMSPYMFADKIETPLLLVHGDADNNPGTFPMQSERLYQALKGHGKVCRFVTLPHEGHGYRARESVMHVLAEMTVWMDRYCKGVGDNYMPEIEERKE